DWGPLLVIWGGAMLVLFATDDLGSALLYYGIFVAMLYVATARIAFVAGLVGLFLVGSFAVSQGTPHVRDRVTNWLSPWSSHKIYCPISGTHTLRQNCHSYKELQSLYSIGHGDFGRTGRAHVIFTGRSGRQVIPELNKDYIHS